MRKTRSSARQLGVIVSVIWLLAACSGNDTASYIDSAKTYLGKSDYKAAVIQLKNAIAAAPQNGEARYLLAKTLFESGDVVGAETEIRKAIEAKYADDQSLPLLGQILLAQGKAKAVVTELGSVKLQTPAARGDVAVSLAISNGMLGNATAANESMAAALLEAPNDPRVLVTKGRFAAQSGDTAGAMKSLDAALAASPDNRDALFAKAQIEVVTGQRKEAIATLDRLSKVHPEAHAARATLISLLVASGDVETAAGELTKLKELAPGEFGTVYSDALVSLAKGDAKRSHELTQKILGAQPDNLQSLYLAGLADIQLKSYSSAEDALQKVVSAVPTDASARRALATSYIRSGQAPRAIEMLEPLMRAFPNSPDLLRLSAEASLAAGNLRSGRELFEKADALDKGTVSTKVRLAQVRLATGETQQAFKDLESLAEADASENQADLTLILAYAQRREFGKALAAIDALEKKKPKNVVPENLRGAIYMAQRDYPKARASFTKSFDANPTDYPAAFNLSLLDLMEGKADAARRRFEGVVEKNPKNEQFLLGLAELGALSSDTPDTAKGLIERAIAANPQSTAPRLALVNLYMRARDFRAAVNAGQAALAALPDNPRLLDAMAGAQVAAGDTAQALETYRRLATVQPKNVMATVRVGEIQLAGKDYPAAIATAKKVISENPDAAPARVLLAKAQVASGQASAALADAQKLQKEKPDRAAGFVLEAEVLASQGKWAEAASAMRLGLVKEPQPLVAVSAYVALQKAGKQADATAFANMWMRDHPRDVTMSSLLAEQAMASKDYPAAIAKYRAILEASPENTAALNNLAWLLGEAGDKQAVEYAERAYRIAPFNPSVIDTLGWTLVKTGDAQRGTQLLKFAANLAPRDNDIRLHLGQALLKGGDKAGARKALEPLTKLAPESPQRTEAEKLLAGT